MRGTRKLLRSRHRNGRSEDKATPHELRCGQSRDTNLGQRVTMQKAPFNRPAAELCIVSFDRGHAQHRSCRAPRAGARQCASRRVGRVRYTPPGCDEHPPSRAIPFPGRACSNGTPCATKPRTQAEAGGFVPVNLLRHNRRPVARRKGLLRLLPSLRDKDVPLHGRGRKPCVCRPTAPRLTLRVCEKSLCNAVAASKTLALAIHPRRYFSAGGFARGAAPFLPNNG